MQFKINEIFQSIQGEGRNTGKPSLFIRVYGCDYNCSFCDSADASIWERKNYTEYNEDDLIEKIKTEITNTNIKNIVLTGGNPCIYDFSKIIEVFTGLNITFEVETQGSKYADWLSMVDLITISPKFSHKQAFKHFEDFIAKIFSYIYHSLSRMEIQFKFVVDVLGEFDCNLVDDFENIKKCLEIFEANNTLSSCVKTLLLKNIYMHFIENGTDYQDGNYIAKFNKLFEYYTFNQELELPYKDKIKFGLQLHKLLEMR